MPYTLLAAEVVWEQIVQVRFLPYVNGRFGKEVDSRSVIVATRDAIQNAEPADLSEEKGVRQP